MNLRVFNKLKQFDQLGALQDRRSRHVNDLKGSDDRQPVIGSRPAVNLTLTRN
jgi:hypothetical protein